MKQKKKKVAVINFKSTFWINELRISVMKEKYISPVRNVVLIALPSVTLVWGHGKHM